ncbi:MAG: SWIM zinc finger domain-containing protein [Desulfobacterales bacterium]|nr:MAG: SWIM zinc finger domain-containing protein [Desulfobacterales bacterium]
MPKKKTQLDQFADLTWNALEEWAGSKIVSRGKNYQRQGCVCDLAVTEDDGLIAWVDGTERYATKVVMDDDGLPDSICTCPYELDCKHGVAVVIEYLKRIEDNQPFPKASRGDARLKILQDEDRDDEPIDEEMTVSEDVREEINQFLKGKTKAQLIELIQEIAQQHPEMAQELVNRRQLTSGHTKTLVTRLRREIQEIGDEPGWQDYWRGGGYTPDYSGIRKKLETLLEAGHADEVLTLGRELVSTGIRQVEESHDEGETGMEVAACMPVIVKALDRSSLDSADKLNWALDAELEDQYEVCEALAEYLHRQHPKSAWHTLADRLLLRLKEMKLSKGAEDFSRRYERDRLSDWAIHALDRADRQNEIIPLCEAEAKKTGTYERLVNLLVSARRYEEAEGWIREGIRATKDKWPGTAAGLRNTLRKIRTQQKNWPAVAAIQAEEFVRRPSRQAFTDCKKAAAKVKAWPKVRESLLQYLEKGEPPWKRKGWPLPDSGLDVPETERKDRFPMVTDLIELAILEKKPERVLYWYDRLPKKRYGGYGVDEDEVATAVQTHAPDRAVAIWKNKAERLIAQVKPKAYQEAGKYLRKAAKVMAKERKQAEWDRYLQSLREHHARKIRLMEVLDSLDDKLIIRKAIRSR